MNFILFNGPPRSGKDTAARIAWEHIATDPACIAIWEKFSFPNKRMFAGMMDTKCDTWGIVKYYEETKENIIPSIGVSYRQFQIDVSEKFMKPLYGKDIFGRLLLDRCSLAEEELTHVEPIFIVSDCGFQIEVDALKDHNVLLFILHREGCDFSNDSREYVMGHPNWTTIMHNNTTMDVLKASIELGIDTWLDE